MYAAVNTTLSLSKNLLPAIKIRFALAPNKHVLSGRGMCACSRANLGSLGVFSAPSYGRTIGSSTSLYDAYIVLPCSPDISSEFQLPRGWEFTMLACVSLDTALEAAVQNRLSIPSVSSHRIHHKTPHPEEPLSVLPVSFALPLGITCLFFFTRDAPDGQQPRVEGDGLVPI